MKLDRISSTWVVHILAIITFSIAALWTSRAVLEQPATMVTYDPSTRDPRKKQITSKAHAELVASDLKRGLSQLHYAARTMATDPGSFFDGWMCFPIGGVTLGEHMLGEGIQGSPAHLLWNDPVATFNFVVTLKPWIGAVGMYALAYYWTGSGAAALIAGFLFGFHPMRLSDSTHPSVVGNEWMPAILLSMDLLFTRRRWRHALALAVLAGLQMLSSMYVIVQFAIVAGIYGTYLLWRHRDAIAELLPKLTAVAGALAVISAWFFGPYLETRDVWNTLERPAGIHAPPSFFWVGRGYFPGVCLLLLASVGLLDRLISGGSKRVGYDPRAAMAVAALAATWFRIPWRVPLTTVVVPPLGSLMHWYVPGVASVRALDKVFFAVAVPLGLLAAYGVRALADRFGNAPRAFVVGLVAIACAAEVFVPAAARWSFGAPMPSAAYRLRPPDADIEAVRDLPPGAVLDLPGNYHYLWLGNLTRYLLLGAYHGRRISACAGSFETPVMFEVNAIANRLPDPAAATELWAMGFRTVIFHVQDQERFRREADTLLEKLADPEAGPRLVPTTTGATIRVARIDADVPVTEDIRSLEPSDRPRLPRAEGKNTLAFAVQGGATTFRHPDPIEPTQLLVTWKRGETVVQSEEVRALLPLALAARRTIYITVGARIPETPGVGYDVTLALADEPDSILGRERLVVKSPAP